MFYGLAPGSPSAASLTRRLCQCQWQVALRLLPENETDPRSVPTPKRNHMLYWDIEAAPYRTVPGLPSDPQEMRGAHPMQALRGRRSRRAVRRT